jgi:hypothetical protein
MMNRIWKLSSLLILLAACSALPGQRQVSVQPNTALTGTPIANDTALATGGPVLTPQALPPSGAVDLTPYVPFYVTNTVENLVLRADPGYLFEAKTTLPSNARLLVLGRALGGEWIFVQTPFERTGWVFAQFLEPGQDYGMVPLIQPADVQLVRGRVVDEAGNPVNGIQFALVQGTSGTPPRNDAITDDSGIFYAFMPQTASGSWSVSFTAIACSSRLMDKDCKCLRGTCGKPDPEITSISLPTDEQLTFVWK